MLLPLVDKTWSRVHRRPRPPSRSRSSKNADGTGCPLKRKLGTFRHCGQVAVEYQLFVPIQVEIVAVIFSTQAFTEAQNEQTFSGLLPILDLPICG